MTRRSSSRAADAAKGLAALTAVAALVAGVPAGLWSTVGWPLPASAPAWGDVTRALRDTYVPDEFLLNALAIVCWLAWAQLVVALTVEAAAAIRRRPALRVPLAGPLQNAAAHLVAAVLLLGTLTGPRVASATPPPLPTVELVAADPDRALLAVPAPPQPIAPTAQRVEAPQKAEDAAALPTYTVQRFDDLWSIAERHLNDPYRWTDIRDLNRGRAFDGTAFRDPDLIHPGWTLDLPADAIGLLRQAGNTPTEPPPSAPPPDAAQLPDDDGDQDAAVHADDQTDAGPDSQAQTPPAVPTPDPPPTPTTYADPADTRADDVATPPPSASPPLPTPTTAPIIHDGEQSAGPLAVQLPSGAVVGLSFAAGVATSLAASRLHQRRGRQPTDPAPGIRHTEPLATESVRRLRRAHLTAEASERPVGDLLAPDTLPAIDDAAPVPVAAPGTVTAGHRQGQPVTINLIDIGGLSLLGPAADTTARSLLVDFLASSPRGRAEALITRAIAQQLAPDVAPFPGLDLVDGLDAALTRLEIELIHRNRLLDTADAADFATFTRRHPQEPIAALLLVTDAPDAALQPRLAAVLGLGGRLGITALVLGHQPDLPTITSAPDGHVGAIDPAQALSDLAEARLAALGTDDATQLLGVIAAGRTADRGEPESEAEADADPFPVQPVAAAPPIAVTLLGPPRIEAGGAEISTGLRSKARELLAFFLVHPQGAILGAAVDALWPDADPQRGVERFRTVLGNLRSTLRTAARLEEAGIIDRVGERYQADATLIDCDLWRFQTALTDATTTPDAAAVIAALQQATEAYGGDLAAGTYYEWAEAPREDLRRRAVDAAARLAELHEQTGDLDTALAALDVAIHHDPYTEELYRRTMRLQATLDRPDAVRRTYRLLETRLDDLDVEPDEHTDRLLAELLASAASRPGKQIANSGTSA